MKVIAPAKLNLYLHITGRRDDGYHFLESIFVFTKFGDVITISPAETLSLEIDGAFSAALKNEAIETNLVYRAALLLQKKFSILSGAKIHITKNIPVGAGLGGGSSDAAAVLKGLNQFWNINCDTKILCDIALSLGADIPACIIGKPAIVSGVGEIVKPIHLPFMLPILFINPNKLLSTQTVFQAYQKNNAVFTEKNSDNTFTDLSSFFSFLSKTKNDLEKSAIMLQPTIEIILNTLKQQTGCKLARMSGSGATCFGLFEDSHSAKIAEEKIKKLFPDFWVKLDQLA